MPEDASLDQFLNADADADTDSDESDGDESDGEATTAGSTVDEPVAAGADEPPVEGSESDPEPAVTTYRFDPAGAACEGCGEVVEVRWRDGGAFVCSECKSW